MADQDKQVVQQSEQVETLLNQRLARADQGKGNAWQQRRDKYLSLIEQVKVSTSTQTPRITAVIVTYRHDPDTANCLRMLQLQRGLGLQIVFVDNGAASGELEKLYRYADVMVRLKENTGAYLSRNVGALFADGPVLLFIDDDGIPNPSFVRSHLETQGRWDVDAVRGVVQPKTNRPINRLAGHYALGNQPYPVYADVEGNVSYQAKRFYAVGGWDDAIIFGGGGVDLAIRLFRYNCDPLKQMYIPGAVLLHEYARNARHLTDKHSRQEPSRQRSRQIHPDYDQILAAWNGMKGKTSLLKARSDSPVLPPLDRDEAFADALWPALVQAYRGRPDKAQAHLNRLKREYGDHPLWIEWKAAIEEIMDRPVNENLSPAEQREEGVAWLQVTHHYLMQGNPQLALEALYAGEESVPLAEITEMRRQLELELGQNGRDRQKAQAPIGMDEQTLYKVQATSGDKVPVSILIPTYNRDKFIALTVHSALMQTLPVAEILVVDDGSTDRTAEIMERFNDPRLRYIRKEHSGAPQTRNRAVREASHPWLLWLDSDDMLLPDTVANHWKTLQSTPDAEVIYGDLMTVFADLSPRKPLRYPDWYGHNHELLARLLQSNGIPNPATMVKAELFERFGPFDESYRRAHDYEWWARIAPTAKCKHTDEIVVLWRWHDANMSSGSVKIDYSFDARIARTLLERHSLEELYPQLNWQSPARKQVEGLACLQSAIRLINLGDVENGLHWLQKSWEAHPGEQVREIMRKLGIRPQSSVQV